MNNHKNGGFVLNSGDKHDLGDTKERFFLFLLSTCP